MVTWNPGKGEPEELAKIAAEIKDAIPEAR
jgi:hypothetical protein